MAQGLTDTDPRIEQMQIARLRAMSPARKLQIMAQLNQMARDLALRNIRAQHPQASEDDLRRHLVDRILGPELAGKVYGPLPDKAAVE